VKRALHSVRIGGFEEARRRLDVLMERYPDWPHPWFYRAELLMWVGRLDDARRDLDVALDIARAKQHDPEIERAKWPTIGLAGVHVLQGRPHEALRTIDRAARFGGPPAQPYFAWRGEILRSLGRLEEARAVLERVCPPGSSRLGSWLTLALTCQDLGDRVRPRRILTSVVEQAPALMIHVARTAVEDAVRELLNTPGSLERLSDDEIREILERALAAMRGNRSASCVTFVDAANRLRAIPPNGVYRFVHQPDELKALRAALTQL
jgi:tetratricopeptide (TPR) repeat protein